MPIYDPIDRLVILDSAPTDGTVTVNAGVDLYSDAKNQWLTDDVLNRFEFPWFAIGGQPLPGGALAPQIYFLKSPWKIRPYESNHSLSIEKNVYTTDGSSLFVPTLGEHSVQISVLSEFTSGSDPRLDDALDKLIQVLAILKGDLDVLQALTDGPVGRHTVRDPETGAILIDKIVTRTSNLYEFRDP